jgi:spore photoproduct lyase
MRIGTGEFSDSLMLDHLTEYSLPIVEFFKGQKDTLVEFKTKSANVGNLLRAPHGGNIIVSWSLNPQRIIDEAEWGAVALEERIGAAARCAGAGYKVGFHFDPIFHFAGWGKEYGTVIDLLYGSIKPDDIGWVSLGTFRFTPDLKRIIENRFPENRILDTELLPGFDGKLRYPRGVRHEIYRTLAQMLLKHSRAVPIYLCMEDRGMWDDTGIRSPFI